MFLQDELQAQFKQVQQKAASNRLSERNCVEVIMKLIDLGLLKVIFTLSGREYLTHEELEREIQDEIIQHRGNIFFPNFPFSPHPICATHATTACNAPPHLHPQYTTHALDAPRAHAHTHTWQARLTHACAGRLTVVELQPLLNVDLSHINAKVEELIRRRHSHSNKQLQVRALPLSSPLLFLLSSLSPLSFLLAHTFCFWYMCVCLRMCVVCACRFLL